MIKIDLTRSIAEKMNIHTKDAEIFLTVFTDIVGDSLASGDPVRLAGGGTFDVWHVASEKQQILKPMNLFKFLPRTTPPW